MARIKAVLAEILGVVPMTFDLVGSIVEERRIALMVESQGQIDENTTYRNAYVFVTEVDPGRDAIVAVREYVDTLHAANTLIPAVTRAIRDRGGKSAVAELVAHRGADR